MNAGPSWNKVQRPKNSRKRQSKSQVPHISSQLKSGLGGCVPQPTEDKLKESISPEGNPKRSPLGYRCRASSGNTLFLDFQTMKIIKEDAEEDNASDLSDSERIPVPPSPLTPPDLHLRAEEIDAAHFDPHPGQGPTQQPEYSYPDFLPAPCNSWDLRDMAVLLHSERRTEAVPRTGGLLGKYIDRLVQLEWLQIQTVQCEKGKGAKARPPTAPGTSGALKSPGRSKLIANALSRPQQEGPPKSGPSRKKDVHREEVHPSYYTSEASTRPLDVLNSSRLCSQKQTLDVQTEEKKKKSNKSSKLQHWGPSCGDSGDPKIKSCVNLRLPRQPAVIGDSTDTYKASRAPAHASLKQKGNANNCARATVSSEKKLKTNGGKQNTHKFKS
ncbi:protein FAM217B [Neophocaena asiaeorientalis asiaeorientalis]|uniref:Protein FAM217B n=1 Tax=Neophocaena asiaeorientalis asiaeorientalis TaxID=1706337 RepID=A0A341BTC3_NEOAA|nr:protein FAM217B [Neophocaena asiaeorientalis asiaeorientalis]XP_024605992.1 protein FAM217B [Neophocaena asiaeorientalis asiaeorientalis]